MNMSARKRNGLPTLDKSPGDCIRSKGFFFPFVGRTFPSHPYFAAQLGRGQLCLFNVLKAYSVLDEEVGYCQGLSFVAGILLMHMREAEAFDMLRFILYTLQVRTQYKPDMQKLQVSSKLLLVTSC